MAVTMSEKRNVKVNVVVALGLICIILLINFAWTAANYMTILSSKDSQIEQTNAQLTNLNAQYQESLLEKQVLTQKIIDLRSIRLWEINFKWEFNESASGQHFLHFTGTFFNSGNSDAPDVKADVWISNGNNSVASYQVEFGEVPAKGYVNFEKVLNYTGHADTYNYMVD
jgi:hypothetical protein